MKRRNLKIFAITLLFSTVIIANPLYSADEPPAQSAVSTQPAPLLQESEFREARTVKQPEIKKVDLEKIGAAPYYETFEGLRLAKYFTVAQRVEIFEEPKPIDSYIMDAKKIRWLHWNIPWNKTVEFRSQIQPIFTRAYGTEIAISRPDDSEVQLKYIHDYREIYHNQFPVYLLNPQWPSRTNIPYTINTNYNHEMWEQNEAVLLHSKQIEGIDWHYTANYGYRFSNMNAKNDGSTFAYHENRHTYYVNLSLAPSQRFEMFGQFEYFKSKRPDSSFTYNPDHYLYAGELRMKSKDLRTIYIPRFSYSIDKYYPFYNRYKKYETQFKIGHDFTERIKGSTTFRYHLGIREEVDNSAPSYGYDGKTNPINEMAAWVGTENRLQYNVYDRLWLQCGADFSAGTNMSDFDNWGLLGGIEYYAPGMIRLNVGWRGNHYYNIDDYLSTVYFKFYLFM